MYTFPQLNNKSIIGYLSDIHPQQKLDEKILTDPVDAKIVREVYEQILLNYLDISREEFAVASEDAYEALEYRQLHTKSIADLLLFKEFEEKIEKHAAETEETEMLKEACEILDEEIAALEEELKQVKKEIVLEQPERERLTNENGQLKRQLAQLNQNQFDLQLVCQKKKSENNEIKQQISKLDGEIEATKHEINHIQAQIVKSPEKVKKRMFEVEANLEKERKTLLEAEKQLNKSETQLQTIQKIDGEVDSCLHLLRESVQVMEETHRKEQMNKKHRIEFCQLEQRVRDLEAKEDNLLRSKESTEEAQTRQEAYFHPKIEKAKSTLMELNQEKLKAEKAKSDVTSVMTQEEKKTKTLVLERERMKREYDLQYILMKEQSELLDQDLLNYTRTLKSLLSDSAIQEFQHSTVSVV